MSPKQFFCFVLIFFKLVSDIHMTLIQHMSEISYKCFKKKSFTSTHIILFLDKISKTIYIMFKKYYQWQLKTLILTKIFCTLFVIIIDWQFFVGNMIIKIFWLCGRHYVSVYFWRVYYLIEYRFTKICFLFGSTWCLIYNVFLFENSFILNSFAEDIGILIYVKSRFN